MANASKSFVQSFAEALHDEMRDTGVTVTSLMPGQIATNFFGGQPCRTPCWLGCRKTTRLRGTTGLRRADEWRPQGARCLTVLQGHGNDELGFYPTR